MADKVEQSASDEIVSRAKRLEHSNVDPVAGETLDELTRLRHEMAAIRKMLERLVEKVP
jgi:hypothetical protein